VLLWDLVLLAAVAAGPIFVDPASLVARDRVGEPLATAALVHDFKALTPVHPPDWKPLEAKWAFALGDPAEGLNAPLSRLPERREPVTLPQRTLHPDTPYWYVADVDIPAPSVLDIDADDGAQVYVNGKRIPIHGDCFVVPASAAKTHLVVRVLNKAVYGGLEAVRISPEADYERYRQESERRVRLAALVRKTRLLLEPTSEQVNDAVKAVQDGSEASLTAAEKRLSGFPLTVAGPYLQDAATDRVSIVWETDVPSAASAEWGEGYALTRKVDARSEGNLHIVELTNLKPDSAYTYRVQSGPVASRQFTFRTLPAQGPFEFTVWSDSHANEKPVGNNDVFRQNVAAMRRLPLAFTVGTGDLVEGGNHRGPWLSLFDTLTPLACEVPAMLVGGNHDYDGLFEDLHPIWFEHYARSRPKAQYFAWTAGNARFVALDPNMYFPTGIPEGSEERRWLLTEVESPEWKRATWHFVFLHQPPYSQGWADYHGDLPIRELLDPLIEKYSIDFIVAGHTHDYERWTKTYGRQKVHLLIVGGAGGGLEGEEMSSEPVMDKVIRRHHFGHFRIDGNKVTFEAVATDTRVLDRLEVTK
jgi:hypothetical protein